MTIHATRRQSRQETAWHLRHTLGWPLERIARKMGIGTPSVSKLLERARIERGLPRQPLTYRRLIRPISLSYLPPV